jgi:multiple sugar transport system permease protein
VTALLQRTSGPVSAAGSDRSSARRGLRRRQNLQGWLFIAPVILGILAFQFIPVVVSLLASLTDWDGITAPSFIGLGNYAKLGQDPLFWTTLANTGLFVLGVIPLTIIAALFLAMLANGRSKSWNAFFRTAYFAPYVTSIVAIGLVWNQLFAPKGAFNNILSLFGIHGPNWVTDSNWAMVVVIIVSAWQGVGFPMVILLAGLQGIPESLYEAAKVDGATARRRFWSITLPLLTPQIFFVLIMEFIASFQIFVLIFVLTKGGPGNATNVFIYYLYQNAFTFGRMGYASAMAWVLFIIIGVVTLLQLKLQKKWVFYNN